MGYHYTWLLTPRLHTFSARTLARSPFLDSVSCSYPLSQRDSVPRIPWEASAFGVLLFFFTAQAFSFHPPNFYFFSYFRNLMFEV